MKALINTLNLTVNIHRDAPEATSHDKADLAEFLMAMSQMELFPECDEECDEAPADAHSPVVTPDNVAEVISGLSATLSESTEAATPVMDFGNATVHVAIPNSGSSSGYILGTDRHAINRLALRDAPDGELVVSSFSPLFNLVLRSRKPHRHVVLNLYTEKFGTTVHASEEKAQQYADAEATQVKAVLVSAANARDLIGCPAPVMDFNTPTQPADSMDFNTPTEPADSMDFNTLHADRLQEKICMRLTDYYREVGQAIDDSRLKDKQASVIDACRSVIDEDTKVLVPENSLFFRMTSTSDIYVSTFRRWVNYYVASDNYGATAYTSMEEAREKSTDSSQSIVQVPFIELSVGLLRVQLRAMGVTFN